MKKNIFGRKDYKNLASDGAVLHLVSHLDFGGVESRMALIGKSADESSFRHCFCVLGRGGHVSSELINRGLEVHVLGARALFSPVLFARLLRLVFRMRPALIHSHGSEANFQGSCVSAILRVPIVCEEIGIPDHSPRARRFMSWAYARAASVIAVSSATRDKIVALGEAGKSQVEVVDSPAWLTSYQPRVLEPGSVFRLACVGRLERVKNLVSLIDAVGMLNLNGEICELLIIGDGSLREEIENRKRTHAMGSNITLAGFSPNPNELLSATHLFIQPSFSEGLSMALVEAMSAGIPPLITPVGGGATIVQEDVTGWILGSLESQAIAEKVRKISRLSVSELNQIGKAASEAVKDRFGIANYLGRLDAIYRRVLRDSSPL